MTTFRAATAAKDAKDWSLPSFGSHLNPISTRGGRLCLPYTGVLGWLKFAVAALNYVYVLKKFKIPKKPKGFREAKLAWLNTADQLKSATALSIPRGVKYSDILPSLVTSPP